MPKSFYRWLAVALLALTIPAQGMASVVAGQCMAFGHHQDASSQHEHTQDRGSDSSDHAAHSHSDGTSADENGKSAHCGPCVACCASASIAGPVGLSIRSSPSTAKYFFSQLPPPGVQPHGLDRPPLAL